MRTKKNYIGLEFNGWTVVTEIDKTWSHLNRKFIISDGNQIKTVWLNQLGDLSSNKFLKQPKPKKERKSKKNQHTEFQPPPNDASLSLDSKRIQNSINRDNSEKFLVTVVRELETEINEKKLMSNFKKNISSKNREEGHTKAQSYIDYLLEEVFPNCETLQQYGFEIRTSDTEREHGDFYLFNKDKSIKITCNGKFGNAKKLGGPNMCSMERLIDYLDKSNLPYWVFKLRKVGEEYIFSIFDLFNNLDVTTYNDGPGQLMLNEARYYEKKEFKYSKTNEAMVYLLNMAEKAHQKLIKSRQKKHKKFQQIRSKYE